MTSHTSCPSCTFPRVASRTDAESAGRLNPGGGAPALPVWQATLRMAVISAASVAATVLIATGLTGCADMSGISPVATVRSADALGLAMPTATPPGPAGDRLVARVR